MAVAIKKEVKSMPGLMTCNLDLHIEKAQSQYTWTGNKISQELWWQILAFFEWTYETCKSESQVRLFVNSNTKEWAAWAFPQERATGMTTREIPEHPNWAADRARFSDADGWFYYGTVHHHCRMGAFQSPTDENNEKDQDGLHITVGKISEPKYDLHCRLYQSKWSLPVDLSDFWDVGNIVRAVIPTDMYNTVALHQMCQPPAKDYKFPDEWKANYLVPEPPKSVSHPVYTPPNYGKGTVGFVGNGGGNYNRLFTDDGQRLQPDHLYDTKKAAEQLGEWMEKNKHVDHTDGNAAKLLAIMAESPLMTEMVRLCWLHDISPKAFEEAFTQWAFDSALEEAYGEHASKEADRKKQQEAIDEHNRRMSGEGGGTEWEYGGGC